MVNLMPLKIMLTRDVREIDYTILNLAKKLFTKLGQNIISIETIDGWDGSNVRIVVKEASIETVKKIVKAIRELENEIGKPGIIIPDVVEQNEPVGHNEDVTLTNDEISRLQSKLKDSLGNIVISVEPWVGWDGSNVRIVVKEASIETVKKIVKAIRELENEIGKPGIIIPDVVEQNES